eukprot:4262956-Pleurochrysis_carterae.AAC.5
MKDVHTTCDEVRTLLWVLEPALSYVRDKGRIARIWLFRQQQSSRSRTKRSPQVLLQMRACFKEGARESARAFVFMQLSCLRKRAQVSACYLMLIPSLFFEGLFYSLALWLKCP